MPGGVDISSRSVKSALTSSLALAASNKAERLSMQTQKPSVKIENWAVVQSLNIADYRSLRPGNLLVGKVFGHPRIEEGAFIFSSPIMSLDKDSHAVVTRNTVYRLGEASPDYKAWLREHENAAA